MKRNILNTAMTVLFLLLMNYRFTGNLSHEILGAVVLLLAFWHNGLNLRWYRTFFKGRQSGQRLLATVMNFLLAAALLVSIATGLFISQSLLPFIAVRGTNTLWLHEIHQSSSYVCFILIGLHLGLQGDALWIRLKHWLGAERFCETYAVLGKGLSIGIIVYGIYASFSNHIGAKLFMEHSFGWGKAPSATQFFMDYLMILGCYTGLACSVKKFLIWSERLGKK